MTEPVRLRPKRPCPICAKPSAQKYHPFCSPRCAQIDLNRWFGGNIAVAGLMVFDDVARTLEGEPEGHRYLLPDVCLSGGRFLDGGVPADLPRPVEVVRTDGVALREALS